MSSVHKILTADQKNVHEQKVKQSEIAKLFNVNHSTICCII